MIALDECEHARVVLVADVGQVVDDWRAYCPECGAEGPARPTDAQARDAWREALA